MRYAWYGLFICWLACSPGPAPAQVGIGIGTGGLGFGFNLGSGNRQRSMQSEDRELAFLRDTLDLDKSQTAAVRNLIRERGNPRRARPEDRRRFDDGMRETLTPEQYGRYAALRQEAPDRSSRKRQKDKKERVPESQWDDVYR